ncbi:MAG: ATP-dependent Clp protease adaptor ClpS [Phycisphaeraceae bacterium]
MNEPQPHRPDGDSAGSLPRPGAQPGAGARPGAVHQRVERLPRWRIVLHDDEVHEPMEMIDLIASSLPMSRYAVIRRVLETHHKGTAVLMFAHRELAELYYLQLSKQNLIVTIERE